MGIKQYKNMNRYELNKHLMYNCYNGNLELVKSLLTSPELKEHANINSINKHGSNALMIACANNHINVVQYLLTSTDLKNQLNINFTNNNGENALMIACIHGNLDIVKYLLTSSELKKHANINNKDNYGTNALIHACKYGHLEIVKYLIIDMNMTIDNHTMNWLNGNNEYKILYDEILKLIEKRDLYQELANSIRDDKINNKKIKI